MYNILTVKTYVAVRVVQLEKNFIEQYGNKKHKVVNDNEPEVIASNF